MSVLLNLYSEMNLQPLVNRIGSVMVCMITSNAIDRVFEPRQVKTRLKLEFAASSLSTQI